MSLKGQNILLGVTGSIAAYKAAILVRLLVKEGARVKVVMTPLAKQFITPLTLATLAKNPILVDFFDPENGAWNSHVSLGEWADAYVIAPATANTMSKMAHGIADNLLLTTFLSARCPVFVAPAMDLDMFAHATTQENLQKLRSLGVGVIEPGEGELASGLSGKGRMAEPEEIVAYLGRALEKKKSLLGKTILVTAGATIEAIDPVRFISNHSSGKMGYAIAEELSARGAQVTLVSGKTALSTTPKINRIDVTSADDMHREALKAFTGADAAVMCAAVADYTPAHPSDKKIKKTGDDLSIELVRTKDIAREMGNVKGARILAGFALETNDALAHARKKLADKNLDLIVLNTLEDSGAGFGVDTNKITIIEANGTTTPYPLTPKTTVAANIADKLEQYLLK